MDPAILKFRKENRRNDPWKTSTRSQIDPFMWRWRKLEYLRTIGNMSLPKFIDRGGRNKIYRSGPFLK
jgi:hypothetical protein